MFRVLAFYGFCSDFILNSGVEWALAEGQEVLRVQLAEGESAAFMLRHCLQQLHPIEYFCTEWELFV